MLRYTSERDKANQILNLTSLTVEQFEHLVEPFEQAFVRYMQVWTMEGKPRTARAYTPYVNSPLPTPEDRLLFLLTYLKVASLQGDETRQVPFVSDTYEGSRHDKPIADQTPYPLLRYRTENMS